MSWNPEWMPDLRISPGIELDSTAISAAQALQNAVQAYRQLIPGLEDLMTGSRPSDIWVAEKVEHAHRLLNLESPAYRDVNLVIGCSHVVQKQAQAVLACVEVARAALPEEHSPQLPSIARQVECALNAVIAASAAVRAIRDQTIRQLPANVVSDLLKKVCDLGHP